MQAIHYRADCRGLEVDRNRVPVTEVTVSLGVSVNVENTGTDGINRIIGMHASC